MQITLLSFDENMREPWGEAFKGTDVKIEVDELERYMSNHSYVDAIVSPANSFGIMDGGYDEAIRRYYANQFSINIIPIVQDEIANEYMGEQPIGTSLLVGSGGFAPDLIHTPTMRYPQELQDIETIRMCMRTALMCAMKNEFKHIVIPAFGAGIGNVTPSVVAKYMFIGYYDIVNSLKVNKFNENGILTWEDVIAITEKEVEVMG